MALQPPFALFILTSNVDTEYVNYSLRRVWRGNFMAGWDFWVATDNHGDMPVARSGNDHPQGTIAPLRGIITSAWMGKTLLDCAKWLQQAPAEVAVNTTYFTAMDEHSKSDETVLVCRIVQLKSGEIDVEYFPQSVDSVGMHMVTNGDSKFDEKATNYRRSQIKAGKPVRSKTNSWGC